MKIGSPGQRLRLELAPENSLPRAFFFFAPKWLLQLPFRQGPLEEVLAGCGKTDVWE